MPMHTDPSLANAGVTQMISTVLRAIGFVIANTNLYGPDHNVTRQALRESQALIARLLEQSGMIEIALTEDGFVWGSTPVGDPSSSTQLLRTRLTGLGAANLTLLPGLTDDEFGRLIAVLVRPIPRSGPEHPFVALLEAAHLPHVKSAKFTYQRLTEDEAVVSKHSAAAAETLNPSRLAAAIMEAAESGQAADGASGHSFASAVAANLQHACAEVMQAPVNRTQKGRQAVKRLLLQVEKDLTDRLKVSDQGAEATAAVVETFEDLVEGLEIEGLAARYLKQKTLSEATEARMLRQVKRAGRDEEGLAELREKLLEAGLSAADWDNLLAKGPAAPPDDTAIREEATARAARLHALLTQMSQAVSAATAPDAAASADADAGAQAVAQANRHVNTALDDAVAKIDALERMLVQPEQTAVERQSVRLTMRKLCELLAEIGQELRQPLTVINGTLGMILRKQKTEPSHDPMSELCALAAESGEQLDGLIGRIVDIAGFPSELNPDSRILDALYGRTQSQAQPSTQRP